MEQPLIQFDPYEAPPNRTNAYIRSSKSLEAIIDNNKVFSFVAMDTLKPTQDTLIVQIRGIDDNILMTTMGSTFHTYKNYKDGAARMIYTDTSGYTLLKLRGYGDTKHVHGDRHYGTIDTENASSVRGRNIFGNVLFQSTKKDSRVDFISSDGSTIAMAANTATTDGNKFTIEFVSPLETDTKILVLTAAHFMNTMYFVKSDAGYQGVEGVRNREILEAIVFAGVSLLLLVLSLVGICKWFMWMKLGGSTESDSQELEEIKEERRHKFMMTMTCLGLLCLLSLAVGIKRVMNTK